MSNGFEVTPRVLTTSARQVQSLAARFGGLGAQVQSSAASAAAANPSYLTSAAANEVAAEITRAAAVLAEALISHAGGLGNAAVTYTSTDKRAAWMMKRVRLGVPAGATYA
ncbi:hypothetical protein Aph02nite_40750 [Actinoplanes philippinensis]|uniref:Excreted virulence factor EspC, type VII ESX diderm n=1 Tax=Actinoplanes philippinensis TaxID=35752 RepID=A0A1I2GXI1_9ACTN|nr:hypothetical protein [Actinoplanes philippinensis]GIE78125.1 hypothetical protein Aph02nite_40750 [Actinoplanes philippinensis]SFF21271.1 hypothetical protein SAMN05421541_107205 [Actinoplanes philippinensis]